MSSGFFNEAHDIEHATFFLHSGNGTNISIQAAMNFAINQLKLAPTVAQNAAFLSDFFNAGHNFNWARFTTFAYLCRAIAQGYAATHPLDDKWRKVPVIMLESFYPKIQMAQQASMLPPPAAMTPSHTGSSYNERRSGEDWNLPAHLRARYAQRFNQLDIMRNDFLDQGIVTKVLRESNLPTHTLAKVWEYTCGAGTISRGRFIAAIFMAEKLAEGYSLPSKLPNELISIITGVQTTYSPATVQNVQTSIGGMTFEEKRMDSLKRSEAILQPRREALLEQEQIRRTEIMRKEEEERMKRQQEQEVYEKCRQQEKAILEIKELEGKKADLTRLMEHLNEEKLTYEHEVEKQEFTLQGFEESCKALTIDFETDAAIFRNMTQTHTEAKSQYEKTIAEIEKYTKDIHSLARETAAHSHEMLQLKSRYAANPQCMQLEEAKSQLAADIDHFTYEIQALKEVASNQDIFEAKACQLEKENSQKFSTLNSTLMVAAEEYMKKYNLVNTKGTALGMILLEKQYEALKNGQPLCAFPNYVPQSHSISENMKQTSLVNDFDQTVDPFANAAQYENSEQAFDPFNASSPLKNDEFEDPFKTSMSKTTSGDAWSLNEHVASKQPVDNFHNNTMVKENAGKEFGFDSNFNDGSTAYDPFLDTQPNKNGFSQEFGNDTSKFTATFEPENEYVAYIAMHDYSAPENEKDSISFKVNDKMFSKTSVTDGWIYGVLDNKVGYFPASFFEPLPGFHIDYILLSQIKSKFDTPKSNSFETNFQKKEELGFDNPIVAKDLASTPSMEPVFVEDMICEAKLLTPWKYEHLNENHVVKQGTILPVIDQLEMQTKVNHKGHVILIPKALLSIIESTKSAAPLSASVSKNRLSTSGSKNGLSTSVSKNGLSTTSTLNDLENNFTNTMSISDCKSKAKDVVDEVFNSSGVIASQEKHLIAIAQYDFEPRSNDELPFKKGDKLVVVDSTDGSWGRGFIESSADKTPFYFPLNFVKFQ
uniref:EH domain-containing protein n=1 Tax=Rhabditophanes sp. KR3021 TaxID=114890 RepID=A0AC35U762_9BILA